MCACWHVPEEECGVNLKGFVDDIEIIMQRCESMPVLDARALGR